MDCNAVIVDDDPHAREKMAGVLARLGIPVLASCEDGISGLDALRKHRPTLAVLDIVVPQLAGTEILKAMVAEGIPSIAIMATNQTMRRAECEAAGARFFVGKPYNDVMTRHEVQRILSEALP